MRFTRRRSDRPESARSRLGCDVEVLEGRTLMSADVNRLFTQYVPHDLSVFNPITKDPVPYSVKHQLTFNSPSNGQLLNNEGKIVSGKDRAGDEWTITVHGPGYVIVSDTSPNDGILDDNINTIQIVGSDLNRTYVTGTVVGSFRTLTSGTIPFNRLVAQDGVNSIVLNGFNLAQTVAPAAGSPNNASTGVFLVGGVRHLEFNDVLAPVDTSMKDKTVFIVIGDPSTPLTVAPTIKLNHVFTTVFDSTATTVPANTPITTPTVDVIVNGQLRGIDIFSTSQDVIDAAQEFRFPVVGTTGRTAIQAQAIDTLTVHGAATNLTASRSAVPFQTGFSGLAKLKKATFHGPTDAVGLDVNGTIGSARFDKGLGSPTGVFVGTNTAGQLVPATGYGLPADQVSYASLGYVGGQVVAKKINHVKVGPANQTLQIPTNPDFVQIYRQGNTAFIPRPGTALSNALIVSSMDIGKTTIVGDSVNSEVKSGFHYNSFAAGLEGTRAPSKLGRLSQDGSLLNAVNSATYRPYLGFYGTPLDVAGPGKITGHVTGRLYNTGGITPLTNVGAGNYAKVKTGGYLPPPQRPLPTPTSGRFKR